MFKKLLLGLIITIPGVAVADWIKISSDDEYINYIDPDRTVVTNSTLGYAETWLKMVIHNDLSKDGLSVGDHKLVKYNFKCNSNELGLVSGYYYKQTGKIVDSFVNRYIEYNPAIPESKGEYLTNVVCGYVFNTDS